MEMCFTAVGWTLDFGSTSPSELPEKILFPSVNLVITVTPI